MACRSIKGQEILSYLKTGIFVVNKPKNISSAQVLDQLKIILQSDIPSQYRPPVLKLGHGGVLDHTATGVLAVGVGWGCKLLPLFLHGDKKYVVSGCLGIATDTYNEVGKVIQEMRYDHINRLTFEEKLQKYVGTIKQKPPKFSALKFSGKRYADLTRDGVEVEVKPRNVTCHFIKCCEFSPPHFKLEVSCGGGFYIRSLVHDIGQDLNSCAHVTALQRTKHGPFSEDDMLDETLWNGYNIIQAIFDTMNKYKMELRRKKQTVRTVKRNF